MGAELSRHERIRLMHSDARCTYETDRRKELAMRGLCRTCAKPSDGLVFCLRHRRLRAAVCKRWREKKLAAGLCGTCGARPRRGQRVTCSVCNERGTTYTRLRESKCDNSTYQKLLAYQGGVCAICKNPQAIVGRALAADHCHVANTIRGLLCDACNKGIGLLEDNPMRLRAAADYLERVR